MSCVIKMTELEPRRCFTESGPVMTDTFYLSYSKGNHGTLIWRMSRLSAQLFSDDKADLMVKWLTEQFHRQGTFEKIRASRSRESDTIDDGDRGSRYPPKDLVLSAADPVQPKAPARTAPVADRVSDDVDDFLSGL